VDGFGQDTVVGGETGSDWDILDLRAVTSGVTVTFKASETGIATAGTDQVTFSEIELFGLTDQADSLDGTASSSAIGVDAGSGNDTVTTGSGSDTVLGNAGNDLIDGGAGNDSLDGGSGNDTLLGGAGADTITGGSGADSISAGAGDDVVYTGSGADTVDTGEGSDTIHLDDQDGSQSNVLTDSGVTGTDTIVLSTGAGTYRIQGEFSADQGFEVIDGSGATGELLGTYDAYANFDFTNITLIGVDQIAGTANADTITGSAGADSIDGGAGNDQLAGGAGDDTLVGGAGDDLITGGAGNDRFSVSDGHDTITDFNFGNTGALGDGDASNNDVLDLSGYYDSLSELRADQADDGVLNQSNTHDDKGNAVDYSDNTQFGTSSMTMQGATADSYTYDNTGIVCFTAGTRILTPRGEVAIESLRPGDLVTTLDHGPQPLLWIGTRHVTGAELEANETLRPVLIAKGAMGNRRDLLVSRQHGMLLGPDHLARAVHLARECRGIRIAHGKREVTYVHLLFATHQIVFAEGIPSESFYPGPNALRMMDPAARADLFRLLPGLDRPEAFVDRAVAEAAYGPTARPFAAPGDIAALHDSHQASCAA
jgi:Ca2+-binding RTX toxin-like protein